jgi:methionine sulfoxide reductase heme-binding subunit
MLLPLAVSSNNLMIRRMGGQAWRQLHKLVYPAALLAALHWLWTIRVTEITPIFWVAAIVLLLALRLVIRRPMAWTRPRRA